MKVAAERGHLFLHGQRFIKMGTKYLADVCNGIKKSDTQTQTHGAWLYGVRRTRQDGNGSTWHQPCNNQTALQVHHLSEDSKRAIEN